MADQKPEEKKTVYLFDERGLRRIQEMVRSTRQNSRVGARRRRQTPVLGR